VAAEQRLAKDDFEATVQTGSIEVGFKPTNSIFLYATLVEIADVVTFGPLSPGTIRHAGPTDDSATTRHSLTNFSKRRVESLCTLRCRSLPKPDFPKCCLHGD
jgi:hypothetical protein